MNREEMISEIAKKLHLGGMGMTQTEIEICISALREKFNCVQEPYFEVVYHDEFDRKESRILNPVSHNYKPTSDDEHLIVSDRFEVNFERLIKRESEPSK